MYFSDVLSVNPYILLIIITVLTGFFANPNILSMHRFYRMRLKKTFLRDKDIYLKDLLDKKSLSPYPLINTTANFFGDKKLAGIRSFDFFLLSPFFCGSKLTGYVKTDKTEYKNITLATAITISGAALNPMMGYFTNRFVSFLMTVLNLRLGYWGLNPYIYKIIENKNISKLKKLFYRIILKLSKIGIVFWPYYNIMELFGKSTEERLKINLSDGGHIENLGAFELLKRKSKLILVIDGGMDPKYEFKDLKKLILRARNELDTKITFKEDPTEIIKPNVKDGFSKKNFVIGEIIYNYGKKEKKRDKGWLIYIKASITERNFRKQSSHSKNSCNREPTYLDYKDYHPAFPHEPTTDQFFDELQWEAYEKLGEDIADELLKDSEFTKLFRRLTRSDTC